NCASCHGAAGKGDGDRAPELNPRPRNFAAEKFKFGNAPSQLWNTLRVGSPGTAMASFELLPATDRIAIIHFVRTLIPNPAEDTKEVMAQMTGGGAAAGGGSTAATAADTAKSGPRIPIVLALRTSARTEAPVGRKLARLPSGPGREIYETRCSSCHGAFGEGGEPVEKLAVFPYRYAKAPSLQNPNASWRANKKEFEKIVVGGLAGKMMPGELLTAGELDALYRFVVELANER
ncbi:MAG: cytochrome c, partial [candidate division Zixibacteria bacterium]|nr:cytochrome c [candidate division Zixibacteria bacterium]